MNVDAVMKIMFDYQGLSEESLKELARPLEKKLLRWIAMNHPDNRTRLLFYRMTNVQIGEGTVINRNLVISDDYEPLVWIGERVAISPNVTLIAASAPNNSLMAQFPSICSSIIKKAAIRIEDDAWIGANVIILAGLTIGRCSVIGAGSVVTKSIPAGVIACGVPARVIKRISEFEEGNCECMNT
jgi:acetyltransferase-like isoleucine patch superfamily enzyme